MSVEQALGAFAREYARLDASSATRDEAQALVTEVSRLFIPVAEHAETVDAQGDWQDRARRVINAANRLADAVENPPLGSSRFREIDMGLRGLITALTNTDFREETP
ncbi:hypothetical protein SEA_LIGMA_54 [Gordonia phage Ligma]|nr:hypothetical protein SEA_LIGMA_54 [Gordonia phage Ligma]UQT02153.1 hypothetical protein SEA_AXUMITE_54 [Gordonia phage Axumite]